MMSFNKNGSVAVFPKMQASPSRHSKLVHRPPSQNDSSFKVSVHPTTVHSHTMMGPSGRPTMTTARKMPTSIFGMTGSVDMTKTSELFPRKKLSEPLSNLGGIFQPK